MPTWLKIVLIALAVVLAFLASGTILLYRYVERNRHQWQKASVAATNEGEDFGRGKPLEACVTESLTRADRCAPLNVACQASARMFLQHCTLSAEMPADFCMRVPKQSEILRSASWANQECARLRPNDVQRCTRIITALQDYCGER